MGTVARLSGGNNRAPSRRYERQSQPAGTPPMPRRAWQSARLATIGSDWYAGDTEALGTTRPVWPGMVIRPSTSYRQEGSTRRL